MRKVLKTAVSIMVVGSIVFSGIALAQTDDTDEAAALQQRANERIEEVLAPLVADGTITEAQAEAVAGHLAENMPDRQHRPGARLQAAGADAAEFLGITVDELREALAGGSTLAEIAVENDSSADELIDFMVGKVSDHLDEAVADGKITEEKATERLEQAVGHITDLVNGDLPERPMDRRPPRPGGPGGEGFDHRP